MAAPMLGEIKLVPYNFVPRGFASCEGQLITISENTALYSIVGTIYGGDGRVTMGLPNFKGRTAMHQGTGPGLYPRVLGQKCGERMVYLSERSIPAHTHDIHFALVSGDSNNPTNKYLGVAEAAGGVAVNIYDSSADANNLVQMSSQALSTSGASFPHENMQPYQVLSYVISLDGLYPSRQ